MIPQSTPAGDPCDSGRCSRELETPPDPCPVPLPVEIGGRPGPEPTRYGDWEKSGRCIDF